MSPKDIQSAARTAVEHAQRRYGKGWEHITPDARMGVAVVFAINAFATYSPDSPASDVAAVTHTIVEMVSQ